MSYGFSFPWMFRRGAEMAANSFELVINLKTAKSLAITIPQSLMLRTEG